MFVSGNEPPYAAPAAAVYCLRLSGTSLKFAGASSAPAGRGPVDRKPVSAALGFVFLKTCIMPCLQEHRVPAAPAGCGPVDRAPVSAVLCFFVSQNLCHSLLTGASSSACACREWTYGPATSRWPRKSASCSCCWGQVGVESPAGWIGPCCAQAAGHASAPCVYAAESRWGALLPRCVQVAGLRGAGACCQCFADAGCHVAVPPACASIHMCISRRPPCQPRLPPGPVPVAVYLHDCDDVLLQLGLNPELFLGEPTACCYVWWRQPGPELFPIEATAGGTCALPCAWTSSHPCTG